MPDICKPNSDICRPSFTNQVAQIYSFLPMGLHCAGLHPEHPQPQSTFPFFILTTERTMIRTVMATIMPPRIQLIIIYPPFRPIAYFRGAQFQNTYLSKHFVFLSFIISTIISTQASFRPRYYCSPSRLPTWNTRKATSQATASW